METIEKRLGDLRSKLEEVGFQYDGEQKPHFQNRETEYKFIHPLLLDKFKLDGYSTRATKFYLKPLTDGEEFELGIVPGKTSPLYNDEIFSKPNSVDTYNDRPAWSNSKENNALDQLLFSISRYLNSDSSNSPQNLNTYLFTWNPNKWDWAELKENISNLKTIGYFERRWSCGNSKKIKKGDRIFLIRLGKKPKGIMGSGYAKSTFYSAPHWDGTDGKAANYIDIEFDVLINPEVDNLFDFESLHQIDQNEIQQWSPQQSGISVKNEIVEILESNWFNFINENNYISASFLSNDVTTSNVETYYEGKSKEVTQTRYERNPRARKICLEHYGYSCQICDFNFEEHFGDIGRGFIHVHHITPISEVAKEYKIEPLKDLLPVCPNCHAMFHSKRPAFTVDEIKQIKKTTYNTR